MVNRIESDDGRRVELVLLPNRSLNWKAAQAAFLVICAFTVAITAYFVSRGAWLVLPFAGLELLAVGAGLYLCLLSTHSREVIRIDEREIVIQRGRHRPTVEQLIPRAWTRVVLATDARGWYPNRLLLRSHGRETEIGAHLVDEERCQLAALLAHHLQPAHPTRPRLNPSLPLLETRGRLPADPAAG